MIEAASAVPPEGFSVGICASGHAPGLPALISSLTEEDFGPEFTLRGLVVVASGCDGRVVSTARNLAALDPRILVISEPRRSGKADAINKIVGNSTDEFLVLVNSDAIPGPGSVRKLLSIAANDETAGCVSACPVFDQGGGVLHDSLGLLWSAHNLVALSLNHAGISNHSSDELLLVRRRVLSRLPALLVNDGAYIGGVATSRGFRVRFCDAAKVRIEVPLTISQLLGQRRRIIFGHIQVWKRLGSPPRTMESLIFTRPLLSLSLLVALLSHRPGWILALPVLATTELVSALLAVIDWVSSTDRHGVWRRFER